MRLYIVPMRGCAAIRSPTQWCGWQCRRLEVSSSALFIGGKPSLRPRHPSRNLLVVKAAIRNRSQHEPAVPNAPSVPTHLKPAAILAWGSGRHLLPAAAMKTERQRSHSRECRQQTSRIAGVWHESAKPSRAVTSRCLLSSCSDANGSPNGVLCASSARHCGWNKWASAEAPFACGFNHSLR
jgi:hypothetical protein